MSLMESRISFRFGRRLHTRAQGAQVEPAATAVPLRVWLVVGGVTAVFLAWLFLHRILYPNWFDALPNLLVELIALTEVAGFAALAVVWSVIGWRIRSYEPPLAPVLDVDDLIHLSPAEFEQYVARLFRRRGYKVKLRGRSGDLGVDLEVRNGMGKRAIVQCKRYRSTIGPSVVRELYGTLIHERVAHGFLVTTAGISDAAREWAQGKPLTLIDGETLVRVATMLQGSRGAGEQRGGGTEKIS